MYLAERASQPGCILLTGCSRVSARLQFAEAHITAVLPNCNRGSATSLGRAFVLLSVKGKNVPFVLRLNRTVSCDLSQISRHVHMIPKSSECLCQSASRDQPQMCPMESIVPPEKKNGSGAVVVGGKLDREREDHLHNVAIQGSCLTIRTFERTWRRLTHILKERRKWDYNHYSSIGWAATVTNLLSVWQNKSKESSPSSATAPDAPECFWSIKGFCALCYV